MKNSNNKNNFKEITFVGSTKSYKQLVTYENGNTIYVLNICTKC